MKRLDCYRETRSGRSPSANSRARFEVRRGRRERPRGKKDSDDPSEWRDYQPNQPEEGSEN